MAVSGSKEFEIDAAPADVMSALVAVERLPEWSSAHKSVTVESSYDDGRPRLVRMTMSVLGINDVQLVEYSYDGDAVIAWTLIESDQQKAQDGRYQLAPTERGTTSVEFELTVDPKIPLPGFLVKKGQKTALDTASKGLTKFLEQR
ncbi:SRPBCC family protein [Rhodococcus sp. HNM0569]|uniref:SRPBCC family protein n=1 Tax=Rhodococcus sp. HNM0569 TaxID=2716340 RepID=UPI00146F3542|nr:SRPBCC family protein [Rhodococcus sp. HNM0569]